MRRGEILALRWKDIDLDRGLVAVRRSLEETSSGLHFKEPKTPRSRRSITLPASAIEMLRSLRADQAAARLRLGLGADVDWLVCSMPDGRPLRPRGITKAFAQLARSLGVTATFHTLRHTHATLLLQSGIHPKVAQERLGHSSISTTIDLYSHVTPTMQEDAAQRIDGDIRAAIGEQTKKP